MILWILFVIISIFIYVKILKPLQHWKIKNVPHEKGWPILGNMHRVVFRMTSFAEFLEDYYKKYNTRYFGFYQFLQPTLVIKDIDLIKQITIKDFDNFVDHRDFISEEADPLFGKNLFALNGNKWRQMRATLSPAFTSSKMRLMFVLIQECAEQFTNHFFEEASQKPLVVEMKDIFTRFANDVIATTAFGIKCDSIQERENEFYLMGKETTNFSGIRSLRFFGYSLSPYLMKLLSVKVIDDNVSSFYRNLVKTTMETREREGIIRPDMIHLLMEAKKGDLKYEETAKGKRDDAGFATVEESDVGKHSQQNEIKFTDDDYAAQVVLFFIAGFDTVSTAMCHMAQELAINPEIQKRLQEEIDETLHECNGKVTYEFIIQMKYLDMVVSETLRKWPQAPSIDRVCTKPYIIQPTKPDEDPVSLQKGDLIWLPIYNIHRDERYYPDPDKFDPERFNDENKKNIQPLTYVPFGFGPRNCIGSRYALMEMKIIFFYLLSKLDIVVNDKTQIPLKLVRSSFTMLAEKGFWLTLKPRKQI